MTIRSLLLALPLLLLGWFSILLTVALVTDEAPAYVVIFPGTTFMQELPNDTSILAISKFSITLTSGLPGFAKSLYASGAWIVLPAGLPGCLPLPQERQP
ncbi:hypothetical protein AAFO90_22155 [Phaeobacter sp. CAU 1743]|uniref:hypothetical protein n=1 Tax=Phaeobacter sp. CAU 1743 TaxID=3140367 RepID=UPI0023B52283